MSKTLLIAFLAFQAVAYANIVSNEDLNLTLLSVRNEVFELSQYLRTVFPNTHHAVGTITWQCHRVAETIQNVINQLKNQIDERHGDKYFKQFWFDLQEVHTSLQQIALSTDVNEVTVIRSQLIANLQLAYSTLERMAHVTYMQYPNFRLKLKGILEDFFKGLRVIHSNFQKEHAGVKMHFSPKELAQKIQDLTQNLLDDLSKGDVLDLFLEGTRGVLKKLKSVGTVKDDELDVVLLRLTGKIEKVIGMEDHVKSMFSYYLTDIAYLFKHLVGYIENGSQDLKGDVLIQETMYDYYHNLEKIYERLNADKVLNVTTPKEF